MSISSIGIKGLQIANYQKLKSFTFLCNSQNIGDDCLCKLGNILQKLSQLTELTLKFNQNEIITDDGISGLALKLAKLHSLEKLSICFTTILFGFSQLTDFSFSEFAKQLSSLQKLKQLSIDIGDTSQLSDSTLATFGNTFKNLPQLEQCSLLLQGLAVNKFICSQSNLTDEGLKDFSEEIKQCKQLKNFELSLKLCQNFTDDGLIHLINAISQLKLLETVNLKMPITNFSINGLKEFKILGDISSTLKDDSFIEINSRSFTLTTLIEEIDKTLKDLD